MSRLAEKRTIFVRTEVGEILFRTDFDVNSCHWPIDSNPGVTSSYIPSVIGGEDPCIHTWEI